MEQREEGKPGGQTAPPLPATDNEAPARDRAKADRDRGPAFPLPILPALAAAALCAFGAALPAQDKAKAQPQAPPAKTRDHRQDEVDKLKEAIKKNGKLPAGDKGADYWRAGEALHRATRQTRAAAVVKKGAKPSANFTGKGSALVTVGDPPAGFGKGFVWDRADKEVMLVMFVNAADPLGVSVEGMQAGDTVQVLSASGIASYSEDKGNPLASSLVGLVAAGAKVVVGAEGAPEVAPAIAAAETFAKDQFKATNAKTKRRDPFGVDPGSGQKAREEGGLLVCLPEAGGTFYSGDGDHKNRWVKGDGTRTNENMPEHFNYNAFFPRQGFPDHNTRVVRQSAPMYVVPWDWKFEDNAGYYKVFVKLTKGDGLSTTIPLQKKGATLKQNRPQKP
ncbi:MAG TPA: hypothetical protein VFW33_00005 [Gemmataceae bacterium]|nr:hypothetical protein [Gemmataceae bacterium]